MLASMTPHGQILEVGTFTGYATACLWAGIKDTKEDGYLLSLERDPTALRLAAKHMRTMETIGMGQPASLRFFF